MKIAQVCYTDRGGGAPIAAMRLHKALRAEGEDCSYLCLRNMTQESGVRSLGSSLDVLVNRIVARGIHVLKRRVYGEEGSFNFFHTGVAKRVNDADADVINLHWINAEMMSIAEIGKINKPVVWTFHDMWPFCGAEHYTDDNRYVTGYQSSEFRVPSSEGRGQTTEDGFRLGERYSSERGQTLNGGPPNVSSLRPKAFFDLDRWVFRRKQKHWKNLNLQIVCPSHWLADCVRRSALFADVPVHVIPNGLDLNVFKPLGCKETLRKQFGLPVDKKLILFGAVNPMELRKGGDLLEDALRRLENRDEYVLAVFGMRSSDRPAGMETCFLGSIDGETKMAEIYNCADVVCIPSRQEAFGQTASEPMACGVPVVAFNTTGLMDIIDHKVNGYLAEPFDANDFARGIEWVLAGAGVMDDGGQEPGANHLTFDSAINEQFKNLTILGASAREKAERCWSYSVVAKQYSTVYRAMMDYGKGVL